MSRFFQTQTSTEESSSDDEQVTKPEVSRQRAVALSSESEVEEKRSVRSARNKRYDELKGTIKNLKNHQKIKDVSSVLSDFEDLQRAFVKAKSLVEIEGIPGFYVKALAELEDFIMKMWEEKKTMKPASSKALSTLKPRFKKYIKDFENQIKDFKENPEKYEEAMEDEKEDEPAATATSKTSGAGAPSGAKHDQDDDKSDSDEDMDWSESDDESSSESDAELYKNDPAARFLKKPESVEKDKKEKEKPKKEPKKDKPKKPWGASDDEDDKKGERDGEWVKLEQRAGRPAKTVFEKGVDITCKVVQKKLEEILATRGKKSINRADEIKVLQTIEEVVVERNIGLGLQVKVLFHLIAAIFDHNPNMASSMKAEMWTLCLQTVSKLLELLHANTDKLTVGENIAEESEVLDALVVGDGILYRVHGCVLALIEKMDDEYIKILQNVDAHSTEYVERLRDERVITDLTGRLCNYLRAKQSSADDMCRGYLKRIEHLYYKFDYEWARLVEQSQQSNKEQVSTYNDAGLADASAISIGVSASYTEMEKLCHYIYTKDMTDRLRTRAILYHIYFLALHDYWFQARDLVLMSNLQAKIDHADISTMIIYNRAIVQLGLCAFRKGQMKDAHSALVDIQSSGRAKELLAQGLIPARFERSPEQEKLERRRQMPYHMHISLEILECVYLLSAMLLEIPYMAQHELDSRKRMISKNFHHVLKVTERQTLIGPPETMRDHVVAAAKAMRNGNWEGTRDNIFNEKMNSKVWNLFFQSDKVKAMLVAKIKEECLRTFLFTFSCEYDAISLADLGERFELDPPVVYSIVSKMILYEELMASLDEPSQSLNMHKTEPTRIQTLCLQLAEKVSSLVDNNEKLSELKGQHIPYRKNTQNQNQGGQGQGGSNQGGSGNQGSGGQGGSGQGGGQGRQYNYNRGDYGNRRTGNNNASGMGGGSLINVK